MFRLRYCQPTSVCPLLIFKWPWMNKAVRYTGQPLLDRCQSTQQGRALLHNAANILEEKFDAQFI